MTGPTWIGTVESVNGGVVSVRLRSDMPSTLVLVEGVSYRVGQIGAFLRIPLGYSQLYAVCTQVGAAAIPESPSDSAPGSTGRWLSISLFGESIGGQFERGVSQYPTVGDEVHLVTARDLEVIYRQDKRRSTITVGSIAASNGIPAQLDIGKLVSRHFAILGSTGSGKSNGVEVVLEAIAQQGFSSARVVVVDPHGEYSASIGDMGYVFKTKPDLAAGEKQLVVPFWALPFDELRSIAMGDLPPGKEAPVREEVTLMKKAAAATLAAKPPIGDITADSPVPFSIHKLWYTLDDFERQTFNKTAGVDKCATTVQGDPGSLRSNEYPRYAPGNAAPFKNPFARGLERQLELLKSRIQDARYRFLFDTGTPWSPTVEGKVTKDLDELVSSWIGHDRPITVLDVSGIPSETLGIVVGTIMRLVWDFMFWGSELPTGRRQPLLVVMEEAHLFLPKAEAGSSAHRVVQKIAKEGRKYGVGLAVVTQRPSEIDATVLSQCGTVVALRLSSGADRDHVKSVVPDDLGNLVALVPSLRTGEGLVLGEAVPVPSRIRFHRAKRSPRSGDPTMPDGWLSARPSATHYSEALKNWRESKTR